MAAALAQRRPTRRAEGLQPTSFVRDLGQIAELIELCFATQMESGGRTAVNEMKTISKLGPLVWLFALVDRYVAGLGSGYVWRSDGRVVGNVSLYRAGRHPYNGRGWMIANVSVHPDFRRRGIALAMMQATLDRAQREGGGWIALQVEADNEGAITLYERLGFRRYETLAMWEMPAFYGASTASGASMWPVRRRRWGDAPAEANLILRRARLGGMAWTQAIDSQMVSSGVFDLMEMALGGTMRDRWVLENPQSSGQLLGALWVEPYGWRNARVTQFIDPAVTNSVGRQSLLAHLVNQPDYEGWSLRVETVADDEAVEEFLRQLGFRRVRALTQMRLELK